MNEATKKTPWHLWVVGVAGLLWNAMGVWDFVATQTKNEAYMGSFDEKQLEFFYGFPSWLAGCWAIAVFGGLIGALLLLFRNKIAVPVFAISCVAMIVTAIHNYGFSNALEITGTFGAIFTVVIFVITVALVWYSWTMKKSGVLK